MGTIYLLQEPEDFNSEVYKIGKSIEMYTRRQGYPKASIVYFTRYVSNIDDIERLIKKKFNQIFVLDRGREYFFGDKNKMRIEINNIIDKYESSNQNITDEMAIKTLAKKFYDDQFIHDVSLRIMHQEVANTFYLWIIINNLIPEKSIPNILKGEISSIHKQVFNEIYRMVCINEFTNITKLGENFDETIYRGVSLKLLQKEKEDIVNKSISHFVKPKSDTINPIIFTLDCVALDTLYSSYVILLHRYQHKTLIKNQIYNFQLSTTFIGLIPFYKLAKSKLGESVEIPNKKGSTMVACFPKYMFTDNIKIADKNNLPFDWDKF